MQLKETPLYAINNGPLLKSWAFIQAIVPLKVFVLRYALHTEKPYVGALQKLWHSGLFQQVLHYFFRYDKNPTSKVIMYLVRLVVQS